MENNETVETTTTTEAIVNETEEVTKDNTIQLIVKSPLFLIFAEYLGYESPLIEWAEKWCNGTEIPKFQKDIIAVDALDIYDKMKDEYTDEELRGWYDQFYDVVLSDFEKNLIKLEIAEEEKKK